MPSEQTNVDHLCKQGRVLGGISCLEQPQSARLCSSLCYTRAGREYLTARATAIPALPASSLQCNSPPSPHVDRRGIELPPASPVVDFFSWSVYQGDLHITQHTEGCGAHCHGPAPRSSAPASSAAARCAKFRPVLCEQDTIHSFHSSICIRSLHSTAAYASTSSITVSASKPILQACPFPCVPGQSPPPLVVTALLYPFVRHLAAAPSPLPHYALDP
eukprot:EG_transcript_29550